MVIAKAGSAELNGSNDTMTACRLATAKATSTAATGISRIVFRTLRIICAFDQLKRAIDGGIGPHQPARKHCYLPHPRQACDQARQAGGRLRRSRISLPVLKN